MTAFFYPHLAASGIRKNFRLYAPYLLTAAGITALLYVISFLAVHPEYYDIGTGRESICYVMKLGQFVIAVFALIFLFYTNAFLLRRRKREFGLYSVLGMGRGEISKLLAWETAFSAAFSLVIGVLLGTLLARISTVLLGRLTASKISADSTFSIDAALFCVGALAVIFALLLFSSHRQVKKATAVSLLKSENYGEKTPKSKWLLTVPGTLLLAAAYYLSVTITDPVEALLLFFAAVIMVIIATYLLFIVGSVTLCRSLQKNEKFYYQKRNFVPVSSLCYRMKRNGAGLASVCILSTMVLVTLSATASLYFGVEDMIAYKGARLNISPADLELVRTEFYSLYGCLFFIGLLLSILFLATSVSTLYYKQLSEGYEDAARFAVMRRVGMMHSEIRESVNAQMRLIFLAPLAAAIIHLAFAEPMIWQILQCFQLENLGLVLCVTVITCIVYAVVYFIAYRLSSNAYFKLVADAA